MCEMGNCPTGEDVMYYFHSDHLGSSTYLTDASGYAYQFLLYLPWGETMVEQNVAGFVTPYKFNGKELDEETGYYNYGARYYDPSLSIWTGVDPLADQGPGWSPYNYTFNNPIRFIDPDGRWPGPAHVHASKGIWHNIKRGASYAWNWMLDRRGQAFENDTYATDPENLYTEIGKVTHNYGDQRAVKGMGEFAGLVPYVEVGFGPVRPKNMSTATRSAGRIKSLGNVENGQGYSAVYDSSTGKIGYKMSNRDASPVTLRDGSVNDDVVRQFRGHGDVADAMGGGRTDKFGFVIIKESDDVINIRWNSRTLNPDRAMPTEYRSDIMKAVRKEFSGYKIVDTDLH